MSFFCSFYYFFGFVHVEYWQSFWESFWRFSCQFSPFLSRVANFGTVVCRLRPVAIRRCC